MWGLGARSLCLFSSSSPWSRPYSSQSLLCYIKKCIQPHFCLLLQPAAKMCLLVEKTIAGGAAWWMWACIKLTKTSFTALPKWSECKCIWVHLVREKQYWFSPRALTQRLKRFKHLNLPGLFVYLKCSGFLSALKPVDAKNCWQMS